MAAATNRNDMHALRKSPTGNKVPFTVQPIAEKSGLCTTAAIKGVNTSLVNAVTTPANAAPITTPTAMSTTFPRRMNFLNPSNIWPPVQSQKTSANVRETENEGQDEGLAAHDC